MINELSPDEPLSGRVHTPHRAPLQACKSLSSCRDVHRADGSGSFASHEATTNTPTGSGARGEGCARGGCIGTARRVDTARGRSGRRRWARTPPSRRTSVKPPLITPRFRSRPLSCVSPNPVTTFLPLPNTKITAHGTFFSAAPPGLVPELADILMCPIMNLSAAKSRGASLIGRQAGDGVSPALPWTERGLSRLVERTVHPASPSAATCGQASMGPGADFQLHIP